MALGTERDLGKWLGGGGHPVERKENSGEIAKVAATNRTPRVKRAVRGNQARSKQLSRAKQASDPRTRGTTSQGPITGLALRRAWLTIQGGGSSYKRKMNEETTKT